MKLIDLINMQITPIGLINIKWSIKLITHFARQLDTLKWKTKQSQVCVTSYKKLWRKSQVT
jgi:hypothetical protein